MSRSSIAALALVWVAVAVAPRVVNAGEGVVEINGARALAGGITPSDGAGYPVTLSLPGSYRLTSDLVLTTASTHAFVIAASNVTLDLNGFSIRGPTVCSAPAGQPVTCTPTGAGRGIEMNFTLYDNATIRNGTIRGMGDTGILTGPRSRVEGMNVISNGGVGIATAIGSAVIRDCNVSTNGSAGISSGSGSLVESNVSRSNNAFGISAGTGSTVRGNTVGDNRNDAVLGEDVVIAHNTITGSLGDGIDIESGTVIGNLIKLNTGVGVRCGNPDPMSACNIVDNVVIGNGLGGLGFNNGGGGSYSGNLMNANGASQVSGAGTQNGGNTCNNAPCPIVP